MRKVIPVDDLGRFIIASLVGVFIGGGLSAATFYFVGADPSASIATTVGASVGVFWTGISLRWRAIEIGGGHDA